MHEFVESKPTFSDAVAHFPDKLDLEDFFAGVEAFPDTSKGVPATSGVSWGIRLSRSSRNGGDMLLWGEPRRWLIDWCRSELVYTPVSFDLIVGESWPHDWCALYAKYGADGGQRLLAMVRPTVRAGSPAALRFGKPVAS